MIVRGQVNFKMANYHDIINRDIDKIKILHVQFMGFMSLGAALKSISVYTSNTFKVVASTN